VKALGIQHPVRTALELGGHGDDTALAELQDEARERLPTADLVRRVVVIAAAPLGGQEDRSPEV
jgi:hypothetical protein